MLINRAYKEIPQTVNRRVLIIRVRNYMGPRAFPKGWGQESYCLLMILLNTDVYKGCWISATIGKENTRIYA